MGVGLLQKSSDNTVMFSGVWYDSQAAGAGRPGLTEAAAPKESTDNDTWQSDLYAEEHELSHCDLDEGNEKPQPAEELTYTCKLINPDKRSEYEVKKCHAYALFNTRSEMQVFLVANFSELHIEDGENLTFGYISPGHGFKGRQEWITEDADVKNTDVVKPTRKKRILLYGAYDLDVRLNR